MNEKMYCPVCRKELIVWKNLPLETLGEHVSDPNSEPCEKPAMICSDTSCFTHKLGMMWDDIEGGLFYSGKYPTKGELAAMIISHPFIDGNNAPFGSFNRKWNAEKRAEEKANKHIFTFPKWLWKPLNGMKVYTNWVYDADYDGNIKNRNFGLKWIRIDGVYHLWGMRMLWYSIRQDLRHWIVLRKNPYCKISRRELQETIKQATYPNPEWWRIWSAKFAKFLLKHSPAYPYIHPEFMKG